MGNAMYADNIADVCENTDNDGVQNADKSTHSHVQRWV